MRRGHRDGNHGVVVKALREAGRQVVELHSVGGGVPDLLVCWPGGMLFLEVKNPEGKNRLEKTQKKFVAEYRGPRGSLIVVRSKEEALRATGVG